MRNKITLAVLILLLTATLAFAGSSPAPTPAQATPVVQTVDLQAILGGDTCAPQPKSVKPGCSKTCKVDRDCPAYPDQVCGGGCCVY